MTIEESNIKRLQDHYEAVIEALKKSAYQQGFLDGYECATKYTYGHIEQIKAEIAEYKDDKLIHAERNEMVDIVLEIINKHLKERER